MQYVDTEFFYHILTVAVNPCTAIRDILAKL